EGAGVGAEGDADGGLVNAGGGQLLHGLGVREGIADVDVLQTRQQDDVTRQADFGLDAAEPEMSEDLRHARPGRFLAWPRQHYLVVDPDAALEDAPQGQSAEVV